MSSNSGSSRESNIDTESVSSVTSDLPSASYDGSHLPWRMFRSDVLGPHRIRILESPPKDRIPASFLATVEALSKDLGRFDEQKNSFWGQVLTGRGFGPSPLFPPNLLPPIEHEPRLARCMVPSFSREALPERTTNQMGPLYEISVPHPGLGCGFSSGAFTARELATLPQWLHAGGTVVNFETGYISSGAAMYCPYLTFERAFGNREHRVESANNQCAIGGAFTSRALQMLYAKAWKGHMMPELPISFSCTIDNTFALLNLHWIDHEQTYWMAPLCQFDLSKDVHFSQFLVWTQAIGDWAVAHILPLVKEALDRLQTSEHVPRAPSKLFIDTSVNHSELLLSGLKTTFENIPWRFESEEFTPVSSSTASWGSPLVNDQTFANLSYPTVHAPKSTPPLSAAALMRRRMAAMERSPVVPAAVQTQTQTQTNDFVWQKRLNHAMSEIHELQNQIAAMKADMAQAKVETKVEVHKEKMSNDIKTSATCTESEPATPKATLGGFPSPADSSSPSPSPSPSSSSPMSSIPLSTPTASSLDKFNSIATSMALHGVSALLSHVNLRPMTYGCMANADDGTDMWAPSLLRLQFPFFWRYR
ncbi:hypothetical protein B0A52_04935 [Exophiala mesophila]|uniref:DUF7924 domain-containing protein n=1 Tax=Exophiala mesophila TaxID=212818 RepID=A0A438N736_EXOME|nr:hypothetical protein B0A52_04935 [Exophiala mesophila]